MLPSFVKKCRKSREVLRIIIAGPLVLNQGAPESKCLEDAALRVVLKLYTLHANQDLGRVSVVTNPPPLHPHHSRFL